MAAKSRGENFVPIYNFLVTACTGAVHGNWSRPDGIHRKSWVTKLPPFLSLSLVCLCTGERTHVSGDLRATVLFPFP